ncbi:PepSY-like domain-containing protein [uncultured Draconibacterium sp.]|uniref:PepSY-like domain-containing protein n=1 Tax=uncultured Draconibacterium sp. TaxID=1573823 RepID=UPI0026014265|nr:PepSY-like domain-containing protein [uncultured Draconibacterium sp.]
MKRIFLLLLLFSITLSTLAQKIDNDNVPAVILNAFHLKFPHATDTSWKIEKGNYRVEFEVNNKPHELLMDHKGSMLKHSQDLYLSEIPKAVLKTIDSKAPYYDIHDADRSEQGNEITYEIKFENEGNDNIFWIDERGKLLKFRKELDRDEVPSEILNVISSRYSSFDYDRAKYLEEGNLRFYIIRGEINNYDCVWTIDTKKNVLKYEQDLRNSEIPSSVSNARKMLYEGYEIRDADRLEENGKVSYVLRLRKSRENIYVTFDSAGKVLDVD